MFALLCSPPAETELTYPSQFLKYRSKHQKRSPCIHNHASLPGAFEKVCGQSTSLLARSCLVHEVVGDCLLCLRSNLALAFACIVCIRWETTGHCNFWWKINDASQKKNERMFLPQYGNRASFYVGAETWFQFVPWSAPFIFHHVPSLTDGLLSNCWLQTDSCLLVKGVMQPVWLVAPPAKQKR